MTFSELLEAHLFGKRGDARKRAKDSFIAGAQAASALVRDQLFCVDNPESTMNWERRPAKPPRSKKPAQKRQPYFIVGKNKAA